MSAGFAFSCTGSESSVAWSADESSVAGSARSVVRSSPTSVAEQVPQTGDSVPQPRVCADQHSSLGSGQQRKFTPKWEGACFPLQKYLPTSSKTAAIPGYSGYRRRESIDYEMGCSQFSGFSSEIRRQAHEQKRELGGLLVAQSAAAVSPRTRSTQLGARGHTSTAGWLTSSRCDMRHHDLICEESDRVFCTVNARIEHGAFGTCELSLF